MDGILLERDELLVLLDAARAQAVIGLNQDDLFPATLAERRQLVEQGQRKLIEQGIIHQADDGVLELPELLVTIATVITEPDLALVSVRDVPDRGRQLFTHYLIGEFVVEQTQPDAGHYRLATLPNRAALVPRLLEIYPVPPGPAPVAQVELAEETFPALVEEASADPAAATRRLAAGGLTGAPASWLIEALSTTAISGTIAMLRIREGAVVDARNPAIAIGAGSTWTFFQTTPGKLGLTLRRVDADQFGALLAGWIAEVSAERPSHD